MTNDQILATIKELKGPLLVCLIGPPGAGKSTFSSQLPGVVLSMETTVDPMFKGTKEAYLLHKFYNAYFSNHNIIVDRICMTQKARRKQLGHPLIGYKLIAVNLHNVGVSELVKRMSIRPEISRRIPEHVLEKIFSEYEPPSKDEGFDLILTRTTS